MDVLSCSDVRGRVFCLSPLYMMLALVFHKCPRKDTVQGHCARKDLVGTGVVQSLAAEKFDA